MIQSIVPFIPIVLLIAGALITKRIPETMLFVSFVGAVILYKERFFTGWIDMAYGALSSESCEFILLILLLFGALIKLFQESGAMKGLGNALSGLTGGRKKALLCTWIVSMLLFIDDYLATLACSFSMRELTDRAGIPREHLALQTVITTLCFCMLVPFSSMAAFTTGLIGDQGLGFSDYLKSIPLMIFPLIMLVITLLLAFGILPKIGRLKEAYDRVEQGGDVLLKEENVAQIVSIELDHEVEASSALYFVIPMIALIGGTFVFDNDIVHGLILALVIQGVLYIPGKLMTGKEFFEHFFEGGKSMFTVMVIVSIGYIISRVNTELQFFQVFSGIIMKHVPIKLLPPMLFLIVMLAVFATAGYWTMQVIAVPICVPLGLACGLDASVTIGCMMSGVACGAMMCFYLDPIFMTSGGTGVSNITIVKTSLPYILIGAVMTFIAYLIIGFVMI